MGGGLGAESVKDPLKHTHSPPAPIPLKIYVLPMQLENCHKVKITLPTKSLVNHSNTKETNE